MTTTKPLLPESMLAAWSRHETELRQWLASRLPIKADADDLLQDVFVKTLRQADQWSGVTQPRAWLFEVARNTLIDHLRRAHDLLPLPDDLDDWPDTPDAPEPVDQLAQACLPRVLAELEPQDREAIELCDLQGLTQADYARLKHISLPAAKSRLQRARRRMRERMTAACQVRFNDAGGIADFVPRQPSGDGCSGLTSPSCPSDP